MKVLLLILVFVISRALLYAMGLRAYIWDDTHFMHVIPMEWFNLESIWYYHAQPPLFTIFFDGIKTIFPGCYNIVFQCIYWGLGVVITLTVYQILVELKVNKWVATIGTIIFILSPSIVLFENLIFYEYLVTTLIALSGLALIRFIKYNKESDAILFIILCGVLPLLRSVFNIGWLIIILIPIVTLCRKKNILITATIMATLVFGLYAKNYYYFGIFNSSSWGGMSFYRVSTLQLPFNERLKLAQDGKISASNILEPFAGLWQYPNKLGIGLPIRNSSIYPNLPQHSIPILDDFNSKTGGNNRNQWVYLLISKQQFNDGKLIIKTNHNLYLTSIFYSFKYYLQPSYYWFIPEQFSYGKAEYVLPKGSGAPTNISKLRKVYWWLK